jgi:hypothetical protein
MQGIVISLGGCCGVQIHAKIATRVGTSDPKRVTILVSPKKPRTPQNIYAVISIM